MAWTIEFDGPSKKQLEKLPRDIQRRILDYLQYSIALLDSPRQRGQALKGELSGLWRYRVGDYRVLCRIEDHRLVVLVVTIGHRREVYE